MDHAWIILLDFFCLLPGCVHPITFSLVCFGKAWGKFLTILSEEPLGGWGGGWKMFSTNGKLIRRILGGGQQRRPPYNKLPALHHWLLTQLLLLQNIPAAALSYEERSWSAKKDILLCRFLILTRNSLDELMTLVNWWNHDHYHARADHECKATHTAMIVGSIQDTWQVQPDRKGGGLPI